MFPTSNNQVSASEIACALQDEEVTGAQVSVLRDLAKIGTHMLTAAALQRQQNEGGGLSLTETEIDEIVMSTSLPNPCAKSALKEFVELAPEVGLSPERYGVVEATLSFGMEISGEQRDEIERAHRAYEAAQNGGRNDDVITAQRALIEALMSYARVEA